MDTPLPPRRVPESPVVGQKAAFHRTFTKADVALFIGVTWDVSATQFERRIVPDQFTAGLLTHIGGLWVFLATEMHFEFLAPVYIGDTITAEIEVAERERGLSLRTPAACRAGS